MGDIYILSDTLIQKRIGANLKAARLKQNITQQSLAETAEISVSSVKKIEGGEIGTFETLLRVMRILGCLDTLQRLVDEPAISPLEYMDLQNSARKQLRKRAVGKKINMAKEESEW